MTAPEKLRAYLDRSKRTQREFARSLGIEEASMSKYLSGKLVPALATAVAIERETDEAVVAKDWIAEDEPQKVAR